MLASQVVAFRQSGLQGSRILLVEDALGAEEQANLPGTLDEHPNWRRKLPCPLEEIDRLAKSPEIDALLMPLELGLADLPELPCTPEGAVRLKNGNPGMVFSSTAQYGDEAWASYQGRPVAVGIYKAGELHPSRVFNLD